MAFPNTLKFCFLHQTSVKLFTPDMTIKFFHSGNGRDFNGAIIEVIYIAGMSIPKNVNGAESQPFIFCVNFIENDRWFSLWCILPK